MTGQKEANGGSDFTQQIPNEIFRNNLQQTEDTKGLRITFVQRNQDTKN